MRTCIQILVGVATLGVLCVSAAAGQAKAPPDSVDEWHEDAWTQIVEQNGVHISYIFYPEANNKHNGVVLRLENENDTAIRYSFTLIFRAPETDTTTQVQGTLRAGAMKTGEESGLFWIPFRKTGHTIGAIGLRGLDVAPVRDPRGSAVQERR